MTDASRRASPGFDSAVATGKGDDGTTGLLYGGERIAKDDPRAEAYGTIDEAVAALGLARAELGLKQELDVVPPGLAGIADLVLRLQRELFVVGAELATNPAGMGPPAGRHDAGLGGDGRGDRRAPAGPRSTRRDAARVHRPGRVAHQRGASSSRGPSSAARSGEPWRSGATDWFRDPIWYRI